MTHGWLGKKTKNNLAVFQCADTGGSWLLTARPANFATLNRNNISCLCCSIHGLQSGLGLMGIKDNGGSSAC